ncbi:Zn-ribbon domain-containing OB-fold protein [Thermoflexus sp.]|uniref:Zn-ribbon domain-containing OB-fold protein n=1 Tax=Thermoflexus sp. TaxID=1969742 RepID=UPI0035E42066
MHPARAWRGRSQRYRLEGEICEGCGARLFPPRDVCPECQRPARAPYPFSGRGEVYSYTVVYEPPAGYEEQAPYIVALIKLEEGPLVSAMLTDVEPEEVYIGMPVEMVTRVLHRQGEHGVIAYGYKFRPILRRMVTIPSPTATVTAGAE